MDFDLAQLIPSRPIYPPYPQNFIGAPGYGWMMPTALHPHHDLALLSSANTPYRRLSPNSCYQPYAYNLPPSPSHQMDMFLENPATGVAQLQPYYPPSPQHGVYGLVRHGTGVFHPDVTVYNSANTRTRRRRERRRRNRRRRQEEAISLSQRNTELSSQGEGEAVKH